jgi:hypothetical protein
VLAVPVRVRCLKGLVALLCNNTKNNTLVGISSWDGVVDACVVTASLEPANQIAEMFK